MFAVLVVSHSAPLAKAVAELVAEMRHGDFAIGHVGGVDGSFGSDVLKIGAALESHAKGDGVLVFCDFGSSVMAVQAAVAALAPEQANLVRLVDAPLVEGALAAVASNRDGVSLDGFAKEIENADNKKL